MSSEPPSSPRSAAGKRPPSGNGSGGYGGYGDYGAYGGYSGDGYPEDGVQRNLRDYLLIVRERKWYIVTVFLLVFAAAAVFTFTRTPLFEGSASIQVMRSEAVILQVQSVQDNDIRSAEDLNTQVRLLESRALVDLVAARLQGAELTRFLAPYEAPEDGRPLDVGNIIEENRSIVPARLSLLVSVEYTHPNPEIAAAIANYFVDEYIAYNSRQRVAGSLKAVEELKVRAEEQRQKVERLALELQAYREENGMVSLDQRQDTVTETLKKLNLELTDVLRARQSAEVRRNLLQELQASGGNLLDLDFIASQPTISALRERLAEQNIAVAALRQEFRELHPTLQQGLRDLEETQSELNRALATAAAGVESAYQNAVRNEQEARKALAAAEEESFRLGRAKVDYDNAAQQYQIESNLLENMVSRIGETSMSGSMETENARVIDRARAPLNPVSPNVKLNLALGLVGGLGLGLVFGFFVAFIDDRVKSAYDIEGVLGLPLIGIIPEIVNVQHEDRARIADNHLDRRVAESFYGIHAALQLKPETKAAKCLLVTSTIPGEGKSFTSCNLAVTYASHGEKTVIVDCDLRKPNVDKLLGAKVANGVIAYCEGKAELDDIVVKEVMPNLDVVGAGGRAGRPTQLLDSQAFETLIAGLRERYERIIIDTPPLAAVTDALIVLPLVDVSVYTIYFNKVRRKAAQFGVKQLTDSEIPCCGAILNGLNLVVSGYYYAQYYDKSYQDYYSDPAPDGKKRRRTRRKS